MDIKIVSPVDIEFNVIDFDSHLPSLQFKVIIQVNKFDYSMTSICSPWFECNSFDNFISAFVNGEVARLGSMDSCFELIINPTFGWLEWVCAKEGVDGESIINKGREKLTKEDASTICRLFNDYPKWW